MFRDEYDSVYLTPFKQSLRLIHVYATDCFHLFGGRQFFYESPAVRACGPVHYGYGQIPDVLIIVNEIIKQRIQDSRCEENEDDSAVFENVPAFHYEDFRRFPETRCNIL